MEIGGMEFLQSSTQRGSITIGFKQVSAVCLDFPEMLVQFMDSSFLLTSKDF
jgi:hypothetical protein